MLPQHPAYWLRHGDLTAGATEYPALTSAPSVGTDGIAVPPNRRDTLVKIDLTIEAAGALTASIVLWGYKPAVQIPLADGTLPAVTAHSRGAGWTNLGAIAVSSTGAGGQVRESHQLEGLSAFTRLAAQVTSTTGSPTFWIDFGFSLHAMES